MTRNGAGRLAVIFVSLAGLLAHGGGDVGNFCPSASIDECTDDMCKCTALRTNIGDPVNLADGNTVLRRKDAEIRGSLSTLKLLRSFSSKRATWTSHGTTMDASGIPVPFGHATSAPAAVHWWHNFFTFADSANRLRNPQGRVLTYAGCTVSGDGCWANPNGSFELGTKERLWVKANGEGYVWQADVGEQYHYTSRFYKSQGGSPWYFLTEIRNSDSTATATISYNAPLDVADQALAGCLVGASGTSPAYVPYIRTIQTEDGARLEFRYSREGGVGFEECVLKRVLVRHANDAASTLLAEYSYWNGSVSPPVLVAAETITGTEAYSPWEEFGAYFQATVGGGEVVYQDTSGGCNSVTAARAFGENLSLVWGSGANCTFQEGDLWPRTVTSSASGRGDGIAGSGNLATKYWVRSAIPAFHQGRLVKEQILSCSPLQSCSAGASREYSWEWAMWGQPGVYTTAFESSVKDRRGNYTLTPHAPPPTRSGYLLPSEPRSLQRGAWTSPAPSYPDCYGDRGDCEWYSYSYGPNDERRPGLVERQSLVGTGRVGLARFYESGSNRLSKTIEEGFTKDIDGVVSRKFIGTFNFTTRTGAGTTYCEEQLVPDPMKRTLEVHGPCWVAGTPGVPYPPSYSASDCSGASYPLTQYSYWPATEAGHRANRLKKVARFPNGCNSPPLTIEYTQYDALGNATTVVENGVTTTRAFLGGQLVESSIDGRTTHYGYDNGKLAWVQYPEGNFEVLCHRVGGGPGCDPAGTWTPQLQWRAKSTTATASSWSEKVVYSYWADGTLATESFRGECVTGCTAASGEERRVRKYAADAQRRPTWEAWGDGPQYQATGSYDAEDALTGIGHPYNEPPAFCAAPGGNAGTSAACALLEATPRGQVKSLTQFEAAGGTGTTTRFCYDSNNNLATVRSDAPANYACVSNDVDPKAAHYEYDDFGNLIAATLPNTSDGASGQGVSRFEYDAMRHLVKKQTSEQRSQSQRLEYTYDSVGRQTAAVMRWGGTAFTLYSLQWDEQGGAPPANCAPVNTLGRVRAATDPLGTTWYQYSASGEVLKEQRQRTWGNCAASESEATPNTTYTYTANGNLSSITYPHGREVKYVYGQGSGRNDRIERVQTRTWNGTAWSAPLDVVADISWEPYGDLRGYQLVSPSGARTTVEYYLGDNGSGAPSSSCPTSVPSTTTSDKTGRLRSLRVSSGSFAPGGQAPGDILKRTYTWKADQVAQIDTCYLGASSGPSQKFQTPTQAGGYDQLLRLKAVEAPSFATAGGAYSRRGYTYDARGNRLTQTTDTSGNHYVSTYSAASALPDQLTRVERSGLANSANWNSFAYDRDGRVVEKAWPYDSSEEPGFFVAPSYIDDNAMGPGADTVFRSTNVNWVYYNYWYDSNNRRRRKDYPNGLVDEYFYDQGHQLLEDRGNASALTGPDYPVDEYIWLGGRPVAMYRAKFNAQWTRQADSSGACSRMGASAPCGLYFVVTDHLAKPVLMLNSERQVVGVGEYDDFGSVNRVQAWASSPSGETAHPYGQSANVLLADVTQPTLSMNLDFRAHFTQMDTEYNCGQLRDYVSIQDGTSGATRQVLGGYHQGDSWSSWVVAPWNGNVRVRFDTDGDQINCAPWDSCYCGTEDWAYAGVALREYEYQRYATIGNWGSSSSWKMRVAPTPWSMPPAGWTGVGYSDSSWSNAVEEGAYGTWPWYQVPSYTPTTPAKWIWAYDARNGNDTHKVWFRKKFTPVGSRVVVTVTADDTYIVYLDGVEVDRNIGYWWTPGSISRSVEPNVEHVLAIEAKNNGGPGGLLVDVRETVTPMWTPIRFPGQYHDEETDWFENWNRYYDPAIGRYLSPEPLLQDPKWVKDEASAGFSTPTYAYARNNPVQFTDPNGLYSTEVPPGKSCDLDTSRSMVSRVKTSARRITDDCLRTCVLERLDKMVFQCGTPEAEKACKEKPNAVARASLGESCENPAATAYWCNRASKLNESCVSDALVHEAAHNCGWNHLQGKGVPGDDGHITTNCSSKPPGPTPTVGQ